MNLMYLTFQEDAPLYLGVKNKIEGQISAFEKLGYQVTCSMWQDNLFCFFGADSFQRPLDPAKRLMKQMTSIANEYIGGHSFDVLYLRLDRVSSDMIQICKTARANHGKTIVVEIPNDP